jgi:hypothetical protein
MAALCMLAFSFSPVCPRAQVAGGPKAESRRMRLDQEGKGLWVQAGHAPERVTHVSLGGNPTQQLGLEFTLAGGGQRALAGTLKHKDGQSLVLKIVSSDSTPTSGSLRINYGPNNSIQTLSGRGVLNGQHFHLRFEAAQKPAR